MAAEDRLSGVGLQQEAASHIDPARLVGKWIEVEGLGLGQVVAFKKRSAMNPLSDSKHDITFTFVEWQHAPQTQSVLLRRRKLMAWNKGRRFHLVAAPAVPAAAPAAPASSLVVPAPTPPLPVQPEEYAAPAPAPAPVATATSDDHDIFLSLRLGEAMDEAKTLRQALAVSGESAFICEVVAGEDIKTVVIEKLVQARLVVVLGTATYGPAQ